MLTLVVVSVSVRIMALLCDSDVGELPEDSMSL